MRVKYSQIHDMLISAVDLASSDQDSINRLTNMVQLEKEIRSLVKVARNKAAYDAKKEYPLSVIKQMTGLSIDTINYWMREHRRRTGAPPLYGLPKKSLAGAMDLSDLAHPADTSHPTSTPAPSPDQSPEEQANPL